MLRCAEALIAGGKISWNIVGFFGRLDIAPRSDLHLRGFVQPHVAKTIVYD